MDVRQIGPALSVIRVGKKMTTKEVAGKLSDILGKQVDAAYVNLVETKEDVDRGLLTAFAQALGVDSQDILRSAQSMTTRDETMTDLEIISGLKDDIDRRMKIFF